MGFLSSIPFFGRYAIINGLQQAGAVSAGRAKTLAEAGLSDSSSVMKLTGRLCSEGILGDAGDGRYYVI